MSVFLYLNKDTIIHRLDPRTKLALLIIGFIIVMLPQSPGVVVLAASFILLHAGLARAWVNLSRIKGLLVTLTLFTVTIWSFMAQGPTPLLPGISMESMSFGVSTAIKLSAMMVAGLILLTTTRSEEFFLALVWLRLPYPICFAFALALRWVPEVFDTALRVKEAQQARGLDLESGGLYTRLKRHIPLLVPIFLLTLRRSQTMAWALEARGFQSRPDRTYYLEINFARRDVWALILGLFILSGFMFLHITGVDQIPGLKL
jgi:energy-coupling factor transport system permease protein